jgi:large subunit ribosomal protein L25
MALLKATARTTTGTHKARALRAKDLIPGIIYGHGQTPEPISLNRHEVQQVVLHGERLMEIDLDGKTQNALIRAVQYDPFGNDVIHMDFARVNLDEMVEVTIPVHLRGTPVGATEGGVLQQTIAQVTIKCMVRSIPEDIRVTVDHMKVDDKLFVKDLPLPEGAKFVTDPEFLVASVTVVAEEVVEVTEEAVATPEVIGAKKEEEGEAGAAAAPAADEKKKEKKE